MNWIVSAKTNEGKLIEEEYNTLYEAMKDLYTPKYDNVIVINISKK